MKKAIKNNYMSILKIIFVVFCLAFILYVFVKSKSKSKSKATPIQPPRTIDSYYPQGLIEGDYVKGSNPEVYILKHGLKFMLYILDDEIEIKVLEDTVLNSIPTGTN